MQDLETVNTNPTTIMEGVTMNSTASADTSSPISSQAPPTNNTSVSSYGTVTLGAEPTSSSTIPSSPSSSTPSNDQSSELCGLLVDETRQPLIYSTKMGLPKGGTGTPAHSAQKTIQPARRRNFLYIAACTGNLAAFTCGISLGWTSPEIAKFTSNDTHLNPLLPTILDSGQQSWLGALLPLGAAIGPFVGGWAASQIGRKKSLLGAIVPFIVAFLLAAFGATYLSMLCVRFLFGLGVGCIFTVLPMYIGEIADDDIRGAVGSFLQLFVTLGLLFSYMLGPFLTVKVFNITCVAIPVIFLIVFMIFIPDSPHYLVRTNNVEGATRSLMRLRGQTRDGITEELVVIKNTALQPASSLMEMLRDSVSVKALVISVGLVSLQQLSGINIILFYAESIFKDAGSTLAPEIATIIIGVVQVIASAATPALVEKRGKRFLLLLSAIGMAISQAILALYFFLKHSSQVELATQIGWLPVVCLVIYIITYCLGFGPLPWAVLGEIFTPAVKSPAATVTASACWLLAFVLTKYFALVTGLIGQAGSFAIFAICCVLAAVFVLKCVPETSGKSMVEIQRMLGRNEGIDKTPSSNGAS